MKVLIAIDECIYLHDDKFYIEENHFILLKRYLDVFDKIRFVARGKIIKELDTYQYRLFLDKRVEFFLIPSFHGPKQYAFQYFKVKNKLKSVCEGCDRAILRLPSTTAFGVWKQVIIHKIPYVTEIVFDSYDEYKTNKNIFHKILWYKIHKDQVKACNNSIGVSCVTTEYLQKKYFSVQQNYFTSNYSSIELEKTFYTSLRIYPQKSKFSIAHTSIQIDYKGRKGHRELIKAVEIVNRKGFDVSVYFAGSDYNNGISKLKNYAKDIGVLEKIKFVGYLSKSELKHFLLNSDLFVFPTKSEGLPRVIIEAMALGLPCISSPVSGVPELINKEYLVDYFDVDLLAEKIIQLISSSLLYETASKENFEKSLEYESSKLQKRRREFYTKLKNLNRYCSLF